MKEKQHLPGSSLPARGCHLCSFISVGSVSTALKRLTFILLGGSKTALGPLAAPSPTTHTTSVTLGKS